MYVLWHNTTEEKSRKDPVGRKKRRVAGGKERGGARPEDAYSPRETKNQSGEKQEMDVEEKNMGKKSESWMAYEEESSLLEMVGKHGDGDVKAQTVQGSRELKGKGSSKARSRKI